MKKVLMIIGGVIVGMVVLVVGIFVITSLTSEKIVCKSSDGSITIMFNDKELFGYTTSGLIYDFDGQKRYSETVGVDNYINEFKTWFSENTDGSCEIK